MKVKELIEKLKEFDQDVEVHINEYGGFSCLLGHSVIDNVCDSYEIRPTAIEKSVILIRGQFKERQ